MVRKTALVVSIMSALVATGATGCVVHTKAGGEAESAPPPPPATTPAPAPAPTAETPPPAETPKETTATLSGGEVKIPGNIVFDTGKASLKEGAGSEKVLEQLKIFLDQNPQVTKLRVEGHTDNVGKPEDNVQLSGQRALTIKRWLVDHGVKKDRLIAAGFGETQPIANNATEEGRAQNRRTSFKLAQLSGKPYLGRPEDGGGKVFDY